MIIFGRYYSGEDPEFQVRGNAVKKKLGRAEGGAKIFRVFRVKNHDFTPKNLIFSNFMGGARRVHPLDPPLLFNICNFAPGNSKLLSMSSIKRPYLRSKQTRHAAASGLLA